MLVKDLQTQERKICITVGGGLGDQVCAEPVIRWMKKKWFKSDDIVLMTHFPQLFQHLDVTCYDRDQAFNELRLTCKTHPDESDFARDFACIHQIHPVDYISIRLFRRTLAHEDKRIRLHVPTEKLVRAKSVLGSQLKRTVLVHAGKGWPSNTFPADIWQTYITALRSLGFYVVLVGKSQNLDPHYPRGIVSGLTADLDLSGKTDLQDLLALLSLAPVLISNDSAPVHLAGAFDNAIGLIPSAKHPDFVLPFRYGGQAFRTRSFQRYRAYENDFDFDPLISRGVGVSELSEEKLREIAPSPEVLTEWVSREISSRFENEKTEEKDQRI